ncbi:MAG: hypothetical protein Q7T03_01790 [Deltaproteobacteria bacterium]|nr:hypothetical protein [Deltaproteobacteria bacterium]
MKTFNKKGGISTIAALLTLLSLVAMGAVISYLVSAGEESRANHFLSTQAMYVTQGGIEHAVKKIYDGEDEIIVPPGKAFGNGSFTVSRSGLTLTVTGTVGDAVRVHKVDSPTEADCTLIDVTNANLSHDGKTVASITFRKICLATITIDKMLFTWVSDNAERLKQIKIESSTIYDNPAGAPSGTLLDVADYTVLNGNNNVINKIEWNSDMEDKTITMTFTMADGTTKSATFEVDD